MSVIDVSQLQPISQLPRNYNKYAREVREKGAVVFLRRSKPVIALVDFELWQELESIKREREESDSLKWIKSSEREYKKGKAKKLISLRDL